MSDVLSAAMFLASRVRMLLVTPLCSLLPADLEILMIALNTFEEKVREEVGKE